MNIKEDSFVGRLSTLLNEFSEENNSNTPDFILAVYMSQCLANFDSATRARDNWYGIAPRPGDAFARATT